jgi:hypothetical protein
MPLSKDEKQIISNVINKLALVVDNERSVSAYAQLYAPADKPRIDLYNPKFMPLLERLKSESKDKAQDERNADAQWLFNEARKATDFHPYKYSLLDLAEFLADGPLLEKIRVYRHPELKDRSIEKGLDYLFQMVPNHGKAGRIFNELATKNDDPLAKILGFMLASPEYIAQTWNQPQFVGMLDHIIQTLANIKVTQPTKTEQRIISVLNNFLFSDLKEIITERIITLNRADDVLKNNSLLLQWLKTPQNRVWIFNGYKIHRSATENTNCFRKLKRAVDEAKKTKEVKETKITEVKEVKEKIIPLEKKLSVPDLARESMEKSAELSPSPSVGSGVMVAKEATKEAAHSIAPASSASVTQQQIKTSLSKDWNILPEKKEKKNASETVVEHIDNPASRFKVDHTTGRFYTQATDLDTFKAMAHAFQKAHPTKIPQITVSGNQLEPFKNMLKAFKEYYPGQTPQIVIGKEADKELWRQVLSDSDVRLAATFIGDGAKAPVVSEENAPARGRRP